MISEAQLRSIALFFYFAFQDEKLAEQASAKTIARIQRRQKEQDIAEDEMDSIIVSITRKIWRAQKKHIRSTQSAISVEGGWLLQKNVDLGPWQQFRKETVEDEFLVLIWSKILKFSDDSISKGLGVTTGTIRHRVGRALKLLGAMAREEGARG